MSIRKADLLDVDIVDAEELGSDGYFVYLTTSLVSTDFSSKIITINLPFDGEGLITGLDHPAQSTDIVQLSGTTGADGYFIIDTVLTETTFSIVGNIPSSTGGTIQFMYAAGAYSVGLDPTGFPTVQSHNVQGAIKELDVIKLSAIDHQKLRQLIHFIDEGPADGFASGAVKQITPSGSIFPTDIVWYTDNTLTKKIIEQNVVWSSIVPNSITWKVYEVDGVSVAHTVTDTITYVNNIFEDMRTRAIS